MAARRDTGLATEQIAKLRNDVSAGRRPRVQVSGPQFPAGTTGTVVRIGEVAADGDDFVTVRVKVGGVTDELGFAPKELSMARRGRAKTPTAAQPSPAEPARPARTRRPRKASAAAADPPAVSAPSASSESAPAAVATDRAASSEPARSKSARRSVRRASPATPVTITITSAGTSWAVSAHRGQRVVLKNAAVSPGMVAAVAALVGQPLVEEAVAAVNDTARIEAEARAEELRAELATVEAILHSHRRP